MGLRPRGGKRCRGRGRSSCGGAAFVGRGAGSRRKAARKGVPRAGHTLFEPMPRSRRSGRAARAPGEDARSRVVPMRYGRMPVLPFAVYRGAALVMAHDLAGTPRSGLNVQCCGDADLPNFGAFASPERKLVFDVNDAASALRRAGSTDGKIASCDPVRLQAQALEPVVGRGSPAWPSDLRNRPERAAGSPRAARLHLGRSSCHHECQR